MRLDVTAHFLRAWHAHPRLQRPVAEKLAEFRRAAASAGPAWVNKQATWQGVSTKVIEADISAAERLLLIHDDGKLTLLSLGDFHKGKITDKVIAQWLSSIKPAPSALELQVDTAMESRSAPDGYRFPEQDSPAWVQTLDGPQAAAADAILNELVDFADRIHSGPRTHLVIGGPGTGKTIVAASVFLTALVCDLDLNLAMAIPEGVREYIETGFGARFGATAIPPLDSADRPANVLFADDVGDIEQVRRLATETARDSALFTVITFDPLQMADNVSDQQLRQIRRQSHVHALTSCYRQRSALGEVTGQFIGTVLGSSPFVSTERVDAFHADRQEVQRLAHMEFTNPGGEVVRDACVLSDLKRVLRKHAHMLATASTWTHAPPAFVAVDTSLQRYLPSGWQQWLEPLKAEVHTLDTRSLSGREFQNGLILLSHDRMLQIERGFSGTGRTEFAQGRGLVIPMSRAKDRLHWLVVDARQ